MRTAIIAEDHAGMALGLEWALSKILGDGWDIKVTDDGRVALFVMTMMPDMELAVLDYLLPHADAEKVVSEVLKVRPQLRGRIIICSGVDDYKDDVEQHLFAELGCKRLDKKPGMLTELERMVLEIVGPQSA